jgi:hypothetical protein
LLRQIFVLSKRTAGYREHVRRLLASLMMLAVLLAGLHLGEAAHAHESAGLHALEEAAALDPDDADAAGEADNSAHSGHHHCPAAADLARAGGTDSFALVAVPPSSDAVTALDSLSRAPPLEPPVA